MNPEQSKDASPEAWRYVESLPEYNSRERTPELVHAMYLRARVMDLLGTLPEAQAQVNREIQSAKTFRTIRFK